jgi:hypothetical protein
LGIPPGHLRERLDASDPLCNLGLEPLREGRLGAEEAADVSATIDKLEAEGFESLLGPRPIFPVADKDAFGRFGEVAPFWLQALEVDHGLGHPQRAPLELPVIGIPGLDNLRVRLAQRGGQGHQRQSVKDHGQGVALGYALSAQEGVASLALPAQDELGTVPVAIECKPGTRGPSVPDCPQHRPAAQLVEPIHGIHEEGATWIGGLRSVGLIRWLL